MRVLPSKRQESLSKTQPKDIKERLFGGQCETRLVYVDSAWQHVPVDVEIGDVVVLPNGVGEDCPLLTRHRQCDDRIIYIASTTGQSHVTLRDRVDIRVARQHYVGPLFNRYLVDPDEY